MAEIKRIVLWEQAGGGSILFWVNEQGELSWLASHTDDGLRMIVEAAQPPNLEVYRVSRDGDYISQAPSNPYYGRKYVPPGVSEIFALINRREVREAQRMEAS